jgi:hypothetical protein
MKHQFGDVATIKVPEGTLLYVLVLAPKWQIPLNYEISHALILRGGTNYMGTWKTVGDIGPMNNAIAATTWISNF